MERVIRDCKVCVVGGAGFLGSHLVHHLVRDRGCQVLVIDNLAVGHREWLPKGVEFEHADITGSEDYLRGLFSRNMIEYVFNYAAYPYIPDSFVRPIHVFNVNAMGALKVINAAQEAGCKGILQVSSAEIYGSGQSTEDRRCSGYGQTEDGKLYGIGRIREDDPVVPHSTYGAAKAAIDAEVQVRWREYQTPAIAMRQFNCVGERETHPYVIPEIISQLGKQFKEVKFNECASCAAKPGMPRLCEECMQRRSVCLRTSSVPGNVLLGNNSFRDFQYAGDAARMATELLEKGQFGQVYNMGSESGIKIYDLAALIGKLMGFSTVTVQRDESRVRPWEIWHLQSDNTRLYAAIDARPTVTLEEALVATINDFRRNGHKWSWQ